MKPEIKIRKATKKDVKTLIKLDVELCKYVKNRFSPHLDIKKSKTTVEKKYKKLFKKNRRQWFVLVAEYKKQIIGFVEIWIRDAYSTTHKYNGYIGNVFTKRIYRRKKIASKLLTETINILKERNIKNYLICSNIKNIQAIKTWKSLGFKEYSINFKKTIK